MRDHLLSLREAAHILDCSYAKAARLARAGAIPAVKIGGTWAVPMYALYESLGLVIFDDKEARDGA